MAETEEVELKDALKTLTVQVIRLSAAIQEQQKALSELKNSLKAAKEAKESKTEPEASQIAELMKKPLLKGQLAALTLIRLQKERLWPTGRSLRELFGLEEQTYA